MAHFKISHIQTIPQEFQCKPVESLEIENSSLFVLQNLPKSLKKLFIRNCFLTRLDHSCFPATLTHLTITNGHVEHIDENAFPESLIYLNLSNNLIRQFPKCHDRLEHLNLSNNKLESVYIPQHAKRVVLSNNLLDTIPDVHETSIRYLDVSDNCIQKIGKLPTCLKHLNVSTNMIGNEICANFNKLTELRHLDVSNNVKITDLPIHSNLISLIGSNCMLKTLKQLPPTLKYLDVSDNSLTKVDCSNLDQIRHMNVSNNKIVSIECLSSDIHYMNISNNKIRDVPFVSHFRHVKHFVASYNPYINEMSEYNECRSNTLHSFTEIIKL